jgi:hypothetical protein
MQEIDYPDLFVSYALLQIQELKGVEIQLDELENEGVIKTPTAKGVPHFTPEAHPVIYVRAEDVTKMLSVIRSWCVENAGQELIAIRVGELEQRMKRHCEQANMETCFKCLLRDRSSHPKRERE